MLAAILHLSQIEFQETEKASGQLDIVDTELVEQGKKGDRYTKYGCDDIQNSLHKSFKQSKKK